MLACPTCASGLKYDIESGSLKCEHCSNSYDPYLFDENDKDAVMMETSVFICPGCGAELYWTDNNDITASCMYCGENRIIFDRMKETHRPEKIIPFSLTKDDCKKAYKKAANRAFLSPKQLKDPERIDSFRGIYMPYWKYLVKSKGILSAEVKHSKFVEGNTEYTKIYSFDANLDYELNGISHDASKQFDDNISECLAPYHPEDERKFTPGYLCGFYAESDDDIQHEAHKNEGKSILQNAVADEIKRNVPYSAVVDESSITMLDVKAESHNVMYPVWFMSYKKDKDHMTYATVNGSTGKVVADFPASILKFSLFSAAITLVIFLILNFIDVILRPQTCLVISGFITLASCFLFFLQSKNYYDELGKMFHSGKKIKFKNPKSYAKIAAFIFLALAILNIFLYFGEMISSSFAVVTFTMFSIIFILLLLKKEKINDIIDKIISSHRKDKKSRNKSKQSREFPSAFSSSVKVLIALPIICILAAFDTNATNAMILRLGYYISAAALIIYEILTLKKPLYKNKPYFKSSSKILTITAIITFSVLLLEPMNNIYYICAFANTIIFLIHSALTFSVYNKRSYRRPPQFNKKGVKSYEK